jgi:hypothetical protein
MVRRFLTAAIVIASSCGATAAAAACRDANGHAIKCGARTTTIRTTTVNKTSHTRMSGWILRLPGCGI